MTTTVGIETLAEWRPEAEPLLRLHWRELATYQDIDLDVDWQFYEQAEKLGILVIYAARRNAVLIGYAAFFVRKSHHHYRQVGWAVNDVVWVHPDLRSQGVASLLFGFAEEDLKKRGAAVIYIETKTAHRELGMMLKSRGYSLEREGYSKRVG